MSEINSKSFIFNLQQCTHFKQWRGVIRSNGSTASLTMKQFFSFFFSLFRTYNQTKKNYSDFNAPFQQNWNQSCSKAFNFCCGKKNLLFFARIIHLEVLRWEAFPCFNLLGQNQSCSLFSACVLIREEAQ